MCLACGTFHRKTVQASKYCTNKFEEYETPKLNPVFMRFLFHNKIQELGEHVEQFTTKLQLLARKCSFKNQDKMIRNRIIFGTNSQKVHKKLINKGAKLTLARPT